jgi:hypothetical protein
MERGYAVRLSQKTSLQLGGIRTSLSSRTVLSGSLRVQKPSENRVLGKRK